MICKYVKWFSFAYYEFFVYLHIRLFLVHASSIRIELRIINEIYIWSQIKNKT